MLRFIQSYKDTGISVWLFQYIPCYGLSVAAIIHGNAKNNISIHPMLRFIRMLCAILLDLMNFNTSHVTVYLPTDKPSVTAYTNFNTSHVTVYQDVDDFVNSYN